MPGPAPFAHALVHRYRGRGTGSLEPEVCEPWKANSVSHHSVPRPKLSMGLICLRLEKNTKRPRVQRSSLENYPGSTQSHLVPHEAHEALVCQPSARLPRGRTCSGPSPITWSRRRGSTKCPAQARTTAEACDEAIVAEARYLIAALSDQRRETPLLFVRYCTRIGVQ